MKQLLVTIAAVVLFLNELQKTKTIPIQQAEPRQQKHQKFSNFRCCPKRKHRSCQTAFGLWNKCEFENDGGSTPLIEASRKGHKEIAKLLIENGADVNCKLEYTTDIELIEGWTSLHVAAAKGHKVIAELLIIKGANVNAMDDTRRSPLDWAQIIRVKHSKKIKDSKKEIADILRKWW